MPVSVKPYYTPVFSSLTSETLHVCGAHRGHSADSYLTHARRVLSTVPVSESLLLPVGPLHAMEETGPPGKTVTVTGQERKIPEPALP